MCKRSWMHAVESRRTTERVMMCGVCSLTVCALWQTRVAVGRQGGKNNHIACVLEQPQHERPIRVGCGASRVIPRGVRDYAGSRAWVTDIRVAFLGRPEASWSAVLRYLYKISTLRFRKMVFAPVLMWFL